MSSSCVQLHLHREKGLESDLTSKSTNAGITIACHNTCNKALLAGSKFDVLASA